MRSAAIAGLVLLATAGCAEGDIGADVADLPAEAVPVAVAADPSPPAAPAVASQASGARAAPELVPLVVPVQTIVSSAPLAPGEVPPLDVRAEVNQIRLDLQAANRLWSNDERPAAAAAVRTTYDERFSKIEPLLRANDPGGTLALEYQFGVLARQLGRSGKAIDISNAVRAMGDRLVAAQASMPVPDVPGGAASPVGRAPVSPPR
jgi:hypothetical protein